MGITVFKCIGYFRGFSAYNRPFAKHVEPCGNELCDTGLELVELRILCERF